MAVNLKELNKSTVQNKSDKNTGKSILDFLNNREISFSSGKLNGKKKEKFFSELSILLSSGIDLKSALEILLQNKKNKQEYFEKIYEDVVLGKSLSEALQFSNKFDAYDFYSIKIGEESGQLNNILKDLSAYYERKNKQNRQLSSALSYPIIVLTTAVLTIVFMLKLIVPMFVDIFMRSTMELPKITQMIISLSENFSKYLWSVFFIILAFIIFHQVFKKAEWYKLYRCLLLIKMPGFGKMIRHQYLIRFFRSTALLLSSGMVLLQAIKLMKEMINFYYFEKIFTQVEKDLVFGKSLNESLGKYKIFDFRTITLIKVAEEVNQLPSVFEKLYTKYTEEQDQQLSTINNVLEPFLIIFVGIIVAFILVAMYLPLFQMSSNFI